MYAALLEALVIASAGVLSVGQILIVLVLLSTRGGLGRASAYSVGVTGILFVLGVAALALGSRMPPAQVQGEGPGIEAWFSLLLGVFLLGMMLRSAYQPASAESPAKALLQSLERASLPRLVGAGVVVGLVNLKNVALYLSAVQVIVRERPPASMGLAAVVLVTLVFCLCLFGPIGLAALGGQWAESLLARFRDFLERREREVSIGGFALFGCLFLLRGAQLVMA